MNAGGQVNTPRLISPYNLCCSMEAYYDAAGCVIASEGLVVRPPWNVAASDKFEGETISCGGGFVIVSFVLVCALFIFQHNASTRWMDRVFPHRSFLFLQRVDWGISLVS